MGNNMSFKKDFGLIIVSALIFTASFLWKDFLTDVEKMYFPKNKGLGGRFFFVVLVTVILVAVAVHLRVVFGLSSTDKNPIEFDDSPIESNPLGDLLSLDSAEEFQNHYDKRHYRNYF